MKKKRSRKKVPTQLPPPLVDRVVRALLLRPRFALAGLFVLGFGLALALLSYDPTDPPDPVLLPARLSPANLLGIPGAFLAQTLISALGQTAYLVLVVWFAVLLVVLQRRSLGSKLLRIAGWVLLIPCGTTWAARLNMPAVCFPNAIPGGTIGTWLDDYLRAQYATAMQSWILAG